MIANIGFSAIATLLQAGLQAGLPAEYGGGQKDIFKHIYETYQRNALSFLGYGNPNDPNFEWQQASYISQLMNFSDIVRERGIEEALNTYATGFFNSIAVNAIVESGYTIGQYFKMRLDQLPQEQVKAAIPIRNIYTNEDVAIAKFEKDADGNWVLVGKEENGVTIEGTLARDPYGKLAAKDGKFTEILGDYIITQRVENGKQVYMDVVNYITGETILIVTPKETGGYNYYSSEGEYIDAFIQGEDNLFLDFNSGVATSFNMPYTALMFGNEYQTIAETLGITTSDLESLNLVVKSNTGGSLSLSIEGDTMNNINSTSGLLSLLGVAGKYLFGFDLISGLEMPSHIINPMRAFSIFRFMPSLADVGCQSLGVFDLALNAAYNTTTNNETLRELILFACDYTKFYVNSKLDILKSNTTTTAEKLGAVQDLDIIGASIDDTLNAYADRIDADKTLVDRTFEGLERVLNMFIGAIRGTESCKEARLNLSPGKRFFYDIIIYQYDMQEHPYNLQYMYENINKLWDDIFETDI